MMFIRSLLVIPALCLIVGCGGGTESTSNSISKSQSTGETATVAADSSVEPTSTTSPPAEAVVQFLQSMKDGDEQTANNLLTMDARKELDRLNYTASPPGTPSATYTIGQTRYYDEEKDAAFVESIWNEPNEGGETTSTEVVWAVRLETGGWKLAGMAIDDGKDVPPIVLDFENLGEVLGETQQPDTQVASRPENSSAQQPAGNGLGVSQPDSHSESVIDRY